MAIDWSNVLQGGLGGLFTGNPLAGLAGGAIARTSNPQTTMQTYNPFQQDAYATLLSGADRALQGFGPSQATREGEAAARTAALREIPNIAGQGLTGLTQALNAANVQNNPFLQSAIEAAQAPTVEAFQRGLQTIGSRAQQSGGFGGARHGLLETQLAKDFGRTLADQASALSNQAYQTGLGTLTSGLSLAPSIAGLQGFGANVLRDVGQTQEQRPFQGLGQFRDLISGSMGGEQTTVAPGQTDNPFLSGLGLSQLLQGGGQGGGGPLGGLGGLLGNIPGLGGFFGGGGGVGLGDFVGGGFGAGATTGGGSLGGLSGLGTVAWPAAALAGLSQTGFGRNIGLGADQSPLSYAANLNPISAGTRAVGNVIKKIF